ncbi:MAG: hypothetical protein V2I97_24135, partial [Desulfococcaceae bacterium]|nr:hypothetical protein [Desulfococcaceae bacterium]
REEEERKARIARDEQKKREEEERKARIAKDEQKKREEEERKARIARDEQKKRKEEERKARIAKEEQRKREEEAQRENDRRNHLLRLQKDFKINVAKYKSLKAIENMKGNFSRAEMSTVITDLIKNLNHINLYYNELLAQNIRQIALDKENSLILKNEIINTKKLLSFFKEEQGKYL